MNEKDAHAAELDRLKQELLSFLVDEIAENGLGREQHTLSEPIIAAIDASVSRSIRAVADDELARLSNQASILRNELIVAGGVDPDALAAAIALKLELASDQKQRLPIWPLIMGASVVAVALLAIVVMFLTRQDQQKMSASLASTSIRLTQTNDSIRRLCTGLDQIALRPASTPPIAAAAAAGGERSPPVPISDKQLIDLVAKQIKLFCLQKLPVK